MSNYIIAQTLLLLGGRSDGIEDLLELAAFLPEAGAEAEAGGIPHGTWLSIPGGELVYPFADWKESRDTRRSTNLFGSGCCWSAPSPEFTGEWSSSRTCGPGDVSSSSLCCSSVIVSSDCVEVTSPRQNTLREGYFTKDVRTNKKPSCSRTVFRVLGLNPSPPKLKATSHTLC